MKKIKWLILIVVLFTIFVNYRLGAVLIIDDFSDGDSITSQGEQIGSYSGSGGSISYFVENEVSLGNVGYSLKITYSGCEISGGGYAGISIPLDSAVVYTNYHYISFFIKGAADAVGDNIVSGYNDGANRFVNIAAYLPSHQITTNWQKVVIPIDGLGTNFISPNSLNIAMEWKYNSGSGTIYVDNITLGTNHPGRIIIDSFYTTNRANVFYGDNAVYQGSTYSYADAYLSSDYYLHPYGLKFDFTISNIGWIKYNCGFNTVRNCSLYSNIVFYAKGSSFLTNVKIEISDNDNSQNYISLWNYKLNTTWQKITAPISNFSGLTNSHLKDLGFTIGPECGVTNGTLYLDDIALEIKNYSEDTNAPTTPYNIKVNNTAISDYFVFNTTNGSVISAYSASLSNDSSIESVRFEYRVVNTGKWIFITDDNSVSNSLYQTSLWMPPYQKVFDIRVTAVDIYGNTASSSIYYHCYSGDIFASSKTVLNSIGGWLRDTDFTYVNIPARSFNESEITFSLGRSYNGKSILDFSESTGSDKSFLGQGVFLYPAGIFFNKRISVYLPVPTLPSNVTVNDLSVYYWDNGAWIEVPASAVTDDYGNSLLKSEFDRTGLFISGLSETYNSTKIVFTEEISGFYMSEKILTPNNDGFNDVVTFSFSTKLSDSDSVNYKIVNINGDVVVEDTVHPVSNKVIFSWDGKDYFNNYVSPGVYIIYIRTPNKSLKASLTVIL